MPLLVSYKQASAQAPECVAVSEFRRHSLAPGALGFAASESAGLAGARAVAFFPSVPFLTLSPPVAGGFGTIAKLDRAQFWGL